MKYFQKLAIKFASLKATADLTPDAKVKLAEATSARELAELRLVKAQKAVNNLNADVATKTKALADAKATLQKEEAKLEELKAQKTKDEKETCFSSRNSERFESE